MLSFSAVFGWRFQGDFQFRPISICESLPLPSRKFSQGFTSISVLMPSYSTPIGEAPGNPSGVSLVMLPPPAPYEVF